MDSEHAVENNKFEIYYFHDSGPDAIFGACELENWGVFEAEDAAAAIEMALTDQYPEEAGDNVVPLFGVVRSGRSKEMDRPHVHAFPKEPLVVSEKLKQLWLETAQEEFFRIVGADLAEKCKFGPDEIILTGEITDEQRRIFKQAYDQYLKRIGAPPRTVQLRLL